MCGGRAGRSVATMLNHPIRTLAAAVAIGLATVPAAAQAAGRTETLRVHSTPVSFTYTAADGTVTHGPPAGPPQPGDVLEIDSLDFRGDHRRHAKRYFATDYLRCTFTAGPEPDCFSWVAIGRSLLRFHGSEVIGGTGRYQGATGRIVKSVELEDDAADIVVKLRLP